MAEMKIYGVVVDVFTPRTGTTQTGEPWQLQEIVIEERDGKFVNLIAGTVDNYKTSQEECDLIGQSLQTERMLTFSCRVSSRRWEKNDRSGYLTDVRIWKVEDGDTRDKQPKAQRNDQPRAISVGGVTPQPAQSNDTEDDLPWD